MGGRGASSNETSEKLPDFEPANRKLDSGEKAMIKQLVKDMEDGLPNGDLQGEAEAFIMKRIGSQNVREVFRQSDTLLTYAREQQDINYVNSLKISESVSENKTGYFGKKGEKTYHYRVTNKDGQTSHYEFKSKQTKKQLRQHILDDMTSTPLF